MATVETRIRTTSTHPAVEARFAAAARLAREATLRHTPEQACRAVVDALSAPVLQFEGIALALDEGTVGPTSFQVFAGTWPPAPEVDTSTILTVPLLLDDSRIGELTVYRSGDSVFEEGDAALITAAAAHASLGVARAILQRELDEIRKVSAARRQKPKRGKRKTGKPRRPPRR